MLRLFQRTGRQQISETLLILRASQFSPLHDCFGLLKKLGKLKFEHTIPLDPLFLLVSAGQVLQKCNEVTLSGVQMHLYRKPKRFGGLKKLDDKVENRVDRFLCSA